MADVTLTIDGREVRVPPRTTILLAAEAAGITIPTFCFHKGLSIAANCRMCLVETNKSKKLVPACHTQVMDGMEVWTANERVKAAQRGVLEFILINHPVDCPICDQAGECDLQDRYRDHDLDESRLTTKKVHKPKVKAIGPHVVYDGERCILCTRCVRFTEEVTRTHELTVIHRGEHSEIATFPGRALDNPYSLCTVDLCPVGALTSIPFRFKARAWWLKRESSVCDQCARGCNVHVDTHRNAIQRYLPRENQAVNKWWMCDHGRLSFREIVARRLAKARVRADGAYVETTTREAAEKALARLHEARTAGAPMGLLLSPNATTEDLLAGLRFGREALRTDRVYLGGRAPGSDEDDLLLRNDKNANRAGAEAVAAALDVPLRDLAALAADLASGELQGLVVQGSEHALSEATLAGLAKLRLLVVLAAETGPIVDAAAVALPACAYFEQRGTFVNFEGRVQALAEAVRPASNTHPYWKLFSRLAAGLEGGPAYARFEEVFADLVRRVPRFAGLTWDKIVPLGVSLGGDGHSPGRAEPAAPVGA